MSAVRPLTPSAAAAAAASGTGLGGATPLGMRQPAPGGSQGNNYQALDAVADKIVHLQRLATPIKPFPPATDSNPLMTPARQTTAAASTTAMPHPASAMASAALDRLAAAMGGGYEPSTSYSSPAATPVRTTDLIRNLTLMSPAPASLAKPSLDYSYAYPSSSHAGSAPAAGSHGSSAAALTAAAASTSAAATAAAIAAPTAADAPARTALPARGFAAATAASLAKTVSAAPPAASGGAASSAGGRSLGLSGQVAAPSRHELTEQQRQQVGAAACSSTFDALFWQHWPMIWDNDRHEYLIRWLVGVLFFTRLTDALNCACLMVVVDTASFGVVRFGMRLNLNRKQYPVCWWLHPLEVWLPGQSC